MTVESLRKQFEEEGINPRTYSLDGPDMGNQYVLKKDGHGWAVYFSEYGRADERKFNSEEEACRHMIDLVMGDPTTRQGYGDKNKPI